MKKTILLYLLFGLILSGCSLLKDTENSVFLYNDNKYAILQNWDPISSERYFVDNATWQGEKQTIRVYNDPQHRFVYDVNFGLIYHKENDILPDINDVQQIEKIEIVYSDVNKDSVVIVSKPLIMEIVTLMSQPFNSEKFKNNSQFKETIASIQIYFLDYPAYYSAVSVIKAWDGTYGFVLRDWSDLYKVGWRDYIPVQSENILNLFTK